MPIEGKALKDVARLDTCVTVIDASNLYMNLNSIQKVKACLSEACLPLAPSTPDFPPL